MHEVKHSSVDDVYERVKEIGHGMTGRVYQVKHRLTGEVYALKCECLAECLAALNWLWLLLLRMYTHSYHRLSLALHVFAYSCVYARALLQAWRCGESTRS